MSVTSASIFTSRSLSHSEGAQRFAELLALLAVGQGGVVGGNCVAERAPGAGRAGSDEHAFTTTTSAIEPLPIQRMAPSNTHPSPSRVALVSSATESGAVLGLGEGERTDSPQDAPSRTASAASPSSEPSRSIDFIASPDWTPRTVPRLPSPWCSSMLTRPRARGSCRAAGDRGCPRQQGRAPRVGA